MKNLRGRLDRVASEVVDLDFGKRGFMPVSIAENVAGVESERLSFRERRRLHEIYIEKIKPLKAAIEKAMREEDEVEAELRA
jgi:hypothetical protein